MRLLDSLAEAAGGKVYLPSMAFGCVIAEPVLQESGAD